MLKELKQEANLNYTENGAVTNVSTMSGCLDFFSTAGALRKADEADMITRFINAYAENRDIALKILFFARDIRGGLGERRLFRVILKYLADQDPSVVRKNLALISGSRSSWKKISVRRKQERPCLLLPNGCLP